MPCFQTRKQLFERAFAKFRHFQALPKNTKHRMISELESLIIQRLDESTAVTKECRRSYSDIGSDEKSGIKDVINLDLLLLGKVRVNESLAWPLNISFENCNARFTMFLPMIHSLQNSIEEPRVPTSSFVITPSIRRDHLL